MSLKPKISGYDKSSYLSQLAAARLRLSATQAQTLGWATRLGELAASELHHIEPISELFPRTADGETYRLVYDIHSTPKRYGCLGISLRTNSSRTDLLKATTAELTKLLAPHAGDADARSLALLLSRFRRFNEQIAALRFLNVPFSTTTQKGGVMLRWIDAIAAYGKACHPPLGMAFDSFTTLGAELDESIFDFNSTIGRVRYRSIRCSYTLDDFDLLGPSDPALKVIVSSPRAVQRRYNRMADFKRSLKKKRFKHQLEKKLGREPTKEEVNVEVKKLRPRKETDWITKEVIKACYLGRKINDVFEAQENLVAKMQPWADLRAHLHALLP